MINITIIGMDAVDSLLDRLIAAGEDERAERIERGAWDLETALSGLGGGHQERRAGGGGYGEAEEMGA